MTDRIGIDAFFAVMGRPLFECTRSWMPIERYSDMLPSNFMKDGMKSGIRQENHHLFSNIASKI
jgi:hypothetical protein